jgi:hypothetical protein
MSPLWRPKARSKPEQVVEAESEHGVALAWGTTEAGDPVIATLSALVVLGAEPLELPWHLIDKAAWNPPAFDLRYRPTAGGAPRALRLELGTPGTLPPVVRERVTKSVVISRRVPMEGELGAVLAARRDAAGAVSWTVTFDAGLDAADPVLQQRARRELVELRRSYGA